MILIGLLDALMSVIDRFVKGIAGLCVALIRGLFTLVGMVFGAVFRVFLFILQIPLLPFTWLMRGRRKNRNAAWLCRRLTGEEFEVYVAMVLRDNGFKHVRVTRVSGDQGVDILAERIGKKYAIQCKNYEGAVGNAAVQEAYAGARYYGCKVAVVVCPGMFTRSARELASRIGVQLWDGERLTRMMQISGRSVQEAMIDKRAG